ncbi:MAG: universal stress protein [Burkholderiales bacterium]|nr:universal stress protein [Burkholderiales bacterium]
MTKPGQALVVQMEGIQMSYKTILVHIDSGKRCAVRIDVALRLARQHDAHLVALHAIAPFEPPGYVMAEMGAAILDSQKHTVAAAMARAENEFTEKASAAGFDKIEWRRAIEDPVEAMTLHARYADLVVIGQTDMTDEAGNGTDFPERLVMAAGRPALILPSAGLFPSIGTRILVAWDASREATRAVTDAIPMLRLAKSVHVMAVSPKNGEHGKVPGADIGLFLVRHGVRVEIKTDRGAEIDVGNELLSRAADLDADLIVMGCYGHSRLKEWILGGATRTILESMTAPILMSH